MGMRDITDMRRAGEELDARLSEERRRVETVRACPVPAP